jgi:hypothetical protein
VGWFRILTASQRRILSGLALSVVIVTVVLGWTVWSSYAQPEALSPLPTPSAPPPTATPTLMPSATSTPEPTPSPTPRPAFDTSRAGIIASEVTAARQVSARWGTPLTLVDGTGLARVLHHHYQEHPLLAVRIRPVLEAFHLWFWDALRVDVVTQSAQAASFYSPQSRELYLRRDWTGTQEALEMHVAYGYARAVPEQVGDLGGLQAEASAGATFAVDRELALQAVAEGDALIAVLLHLGVTPGSPRAREIQAELAKAVCPRWQVDDPLLNELSCLAFELGAHFATTLYLEGGTAAMDSAILRPPRTTRQILHPDLYLQPPSTEAGLPQDEVRLLNPLQPNLGRGWVLTSTATMGEAMVGILVKEWSSEAVEPETVSGWTGDLLQVWQDGGGERVAVWQTAWDESIVAGRFYGRLLDVLPRILVSGLITDTTPPASVPRGRWWSGAGGTVFLYRSREQVWLIWGSDADAVAAVAGEIR